MSVNELTGVKSFSTRLAYGSVLPWVGPQVSGATETRKAGAQHRLQNGVMLGTHILTVAERTGNRRQDEGRHRMKVGTEPSECEVVPGEETARGLQDHLTMGLRGLGGQERIHRVRQDSLQPCHKTPGTQ